MTTDITTETTPNVTTDLAEKNHNKRVVIELAVGGEAVGYCMIRLFPDDAPNTVENFITLAQQGFYNGLTFHRIIPNFMIQGGDPTGTGSGGPGYQIPAEFSARRHVTGTVAMARSADPDSAGSQFYICLAPAQHLNFNYTVFGQICEGMEHVLEMGTLDTDAEDRPLHAITMTRVEIIDGPTE